VKYLELLTQDDVEEIHLASVHVLEHVGVKVNHDRALKLLDNAGASVDYKGKIAKIPPYLVEDLVKYAPSEAFHAARDPKNDMRVGGKRVFFGPSNAMYVVEGKKRRETTKEDLVRWTRLNDGLENVDFCNRLRAADVSPVVCSLYEFVAMANNTTKHLRHSLVNALVPKYLIEMASVLVGGEEELRKRPMFSFGYCATSPLIWDWDALENFSVTADYNIPAHIFSVPMNGATSPVTVAGTLVLANAETLSGIVINQLYKKGRPCIYSNGAPRCFDLRTAQALSGSPEVALIAAASAQLARYYGLPSLAWMSSDSKITDEQAAYESSLLGLIMSMSGNNIVWGVGSIESESSITFEQAVIDNDMIGALRRVMRGIDVTDDTLALDLIKKVGIGGSYLREKHTIQYYTKEVAELRVTDRHSKEKWDKLGAKSMMERAKGRVEEILREHVPEPLDSDIQKQLAKIIKKAEKELLQS